MKMVISSTGRNGHFYQDGQKVWGKENTDLGNGLQ